MLLVFLGTVTRNGFVTMVEYTAPVFWLFFLLSTLSLIVLRRREPGAQRPFKVPFYPLTPILFSAICLCMLISSLQYNGAGALAGIAVLAAGIPFHDLSEKAKVMKRGERHAKKIVFIVLLLATLARLTFCSVMPRVKTEPDVIFVPTPHRVVRQMLKLADVKKDDVLYDLGSGDGRIVIAAARDFGARAVGIELDQDLINESVENAKKAGVAERTSFRKEDFFIADIHEATVVALFLLPRA